MASDTERRYADEDTIVVDSDARAARAEEWPVAELYRVDPEEGSLGIASGEDTAVLSPTAPAARRRRPRSLGTALLAIGGACALGAAVLAAVLFESGAEGQPTRGPAAASTSPTPPATNPTPSAPVTPSTVEETTTSDVPPTVRVPSVVGLQASKAAATLREAGFVAKIRVVVSTERTGVVVAQSPPGDTNAKRGSAVRMRVSKRRSAPSRVEAPAQVEVPDLVGLDVAEARNRLASLGLSVVVNGVASEQAAGTVLQQSHRAGSSLPEHGRVTLTVSSGPAMLDVPDVIGLDEQSARSQLVDTGFGVEVTYEATTDPTKDGLVDRQTPAGGTTAADRSVVTIVILRLG